MLNFDLTFLHCGIMPRCEAVIDKHWGGYYSLQFIRRGAVELFYDDERHVVEAPAFWTCYPGPRIRFHALRGTTWHHSYFALRGPGMVRLRQSGLLVLGTQSCPQRDSSHYAGLMDRIVHLVRSPGALSLPRAANLFESLLLDLAERRRLRTHVEPWLEEILSVLESPSTTKPDYAALARRFGMASSTLRRRFHQETGTALHRYTLERRLGQARELVGNTDLPFKEIAEQLGYDNPFFFSRQFRRFHGVPPGAYRHSRQG